MSADEMSTPDPMCRERGIPESACPDYCRHGCACVIGICSEDGECCEAECSAPDQATDGKAEAAREAFALGAAWALGDDDEAPPALKARAEAAEAEVERLTAERDEYERRWEEDARPAFAIVKAVERLADKFGATPSWCMSYRNVATSIRTTLAEAEAESGESR